MSQALAAPLTENQLDLLDEFLLSEQVSEEALDLIGAHGLICALNISPVKTPQSEWLQLIFDGEPNWKSAEQKQQIEQLLIQLNAEIHGELENDGEVMLPCETSLEVDDDEEQPLITIWTQGFMEAVFMHEEQWFNHQKEAEVAELMLPIMVASDLFDEDEFQQIRKKRKLRAEMADQVPDVLVDLFLLLNTPDK